MVLSDSFILIWLFTSFILGVIVKTAAVAKGYHNNGWFWYAVLLGPIALVHVLIMPADAEQLTRDAVESGTMRKCPRCAELVKTEAVVCRFCQSPLSAVQSMPKAPLLTVTETPRVLDPSESASLLRKRRIAIAVLIATSGLLAAAYMTER